MGRNFAQPVHALTKEEHDALVELLGRPLTQHPVGSYRRNGVQTNADDMRPSEAPK